MHHSVRAAIVGAGFAGSQHADALRRLGVEIRSVVGSDDERARAAAARLGVEHATADLDAVIGDGAIDVVHVCVPNALHASVVRKALEAGKHVVCEKPLATSAAEAADLALRAAAASVVAVVCHNYRFYPMAAELRARVADGAVGRPHLVRGAYLQDWLLAADATSWRIDPEEGGRSRAVADIGTHWVDLAETVLDRRVEAVMAELGTVHRRRPAWAHVATFERGGSDEWVDVETEDQAALLVRFGDGLLGSVTLSQVAAGHHNDLELAIDGDAGSASWRQERPDELRLARFGGPDETIVRDRAANGGLAKLPAGHGEGWADALRNLLEATYTAIEGERTPEEEAAAPLPTFADGAHHMAFVEAVLRSHDARSWVTIGETVEEQA